MALEVAQLIATLRGDTSGFTTSMKQANADAADFEAKAKGHFAGVSGAIKGIVGAVGAVGFAEMAEKAIESADQQETAFTSLKTTMQNYGLGTKQAEDSVDAFIKKQAAANGFMETDVTNAYNSIILATKNTSAANTDLSLAEDIARAKHIDLASAANMVAKAADGNTTALVRQFPAVKELVAQHASAKQILDAVTSSVKGQAQAFDNTSGGATARFKSSINELEITVGDKLIPALVKLVDIGQGVIKFFSDHPTVTKFVEAVAALGVAVVIVNKATAAWKATTEAFTAVQAIFNAVLDANPIVLATIAIVAIGLALYEAYEHCKTFRDIVNAVFSWIAGFVKGAVDVVIGVFDHLKDAFTSTVYWIRDRINDVVGFFSGLPGRIASIGAHMFDFLINSFKAAWDWIANKWNTLGFTLPEISLGPVHFGGYHIDLPHLPTFALGGTVPGPIGAPQLAMVHGGEEITPWRAGGSQGGGSGVTVNLIVQGNVLDGTQLIEIVHNGLLSKQRRTGDLGFLAS